MRASLSLFLFLAGSVGLMAEQRSYVATPYSLAGWSLVGAELSDVLGQSELTLPANAQIFRVTQATEIGLNLSTQPLLGETPLGWPVMELGNVALILARHGSTGRLLLVIGDQAPLELPAKFALDADGRSVDPLTIGFARREATVVVTVAGKTLLFTAGTVADEKPFVICVSAGAKVPWMLSNLEITIGSADPAAAGKPAVSIPSPVPAVPNGHASGPPPWGGHFTSSLSRPMNPQLVAASLAGGKPGAVVEDRGRQTLEIYTPSSVRYGRAEVVRAAIQGQVKN